MRRRRRAHASNPKPPDPASSNLMHRFTREELCPVPAGWTVAPPAYVGVGEGSAGTSWWCRLLLDHPQVVVNRLGVKELNYFRWFGYHELAPDDVDTYRRAFAAPAGSICGEWSPGYLGWPFALEHLAEAAPEAKILLILRNPIDRVPSVASRMIAGGRPEQPAVNAAITSCLPVSRLRRARELYGDRLLVLQYERCRADPARELARTYALLAIDDTYRPPDLEAPVNAPAHVVAPLDRREKARLAAYFAADVAAVARLCPEIDLSLWREFSGAG